MPRTEERLFGSHEAVKESAPETEFEIDFVELMYRLIDHFVYILLAAVVCTAAAWAYNTYMVVPVYSATSKLYVMNSGESAINLSDLQIGTYLANDYQEVFKTWEVHEMVAQNLGLPYSYARMQSMLSIYNPKDTRILYITAASTSPQEAAAIANEYAAVAKKYISSTMATEEPNILSVALVPNAPVGQNKTRNLMLGFLLGVFAASAVITVLFLLDDKLKTADDIYKYTGLPTLAVVFMIDESKAAGKKGMKERKRAKE